MRGRGERKTARLQSGGRHISRDRIASAGPKNV